MLQEIHTIKTNDWSMNLEDTFYEENPDMVLQAAIAAVQATAAGYYVNLVTPECYGLPELTLIPELSHILQEEKIIIEDIRYIGECGCGGHVTRVNC